MIKSSSLTSSKFAYAYFDVSNNIAVLGDFEKLPDVYVVTTGFTLYLPVTLF